MEIECFLVCKTAASLLLRQSLLSISNSTKRKTKKNSFKITAANKTNFHQQDKDDDDPFLQFSISRASYRFHETLRPEPLFVDHYAGCFAPFDLEMDKNTEPKMHQYCIATKFIDDQLLSLTKGDDGAKQVVLFTDGMDTRPYRLKWPSSTVIYDVSPQSVFKIASQKLKDVGAKIPRSCLLLHVPLESSDLEQILRDKGFSGSRPSIWVFQGFPVLNLASFKEILFIASNLAMKGCVFSGELPLWLTETEVGIKPSVEKWIDELFMSYGFRVRILEYDGVARSLCQEKVLGPSDSLLFVAKHLRFSDDEMEIWRREFRRVEEGGDEEGFEEL
uniref:O-methyltransferase 1, chloroplastic n=1 Tax=Erigeron canadensis TaxID=72917 RepID=UPI001CB96E16|nr:O-methyltransferase 1, chloroplastic [Erigeron canadensis]